MVRTWFRIPPCPVGGSPMPSVRRASLPPREFGVFNGRMGDRDDFLDWFNSTWRTAEDALHNGDPAPRFETWSDRDPVTLFGAFFNADGPRAAREVFVKLARTFSQVGAGDIELLAADANGDLAYTAHREITSTSVNGVPGQYTLRVTQVYRREDGRWKVVHRHADMDPESGDGP